MAVKDKNTTAPANEEVHEDEASMTSFDVDFEGVPDELVLENGVYTVRVDKATFRSPEPKEGKNPFPHVSLMLTPVDEAAADNIFYSVGFPTPADDERSRLRKQRQMKALLTACNLPLKGKLEIPDLVGQEFQAQIKRVTKDGVTRNEVVKIVLDD